MLIILGGLPASGKTTLAKALAVTLPAMHVRVDTIEQAIRAAGIAEPGPAGYVVAYGIAADNLDAGHIVVADSVNSLSVTRDAWLAVAARTGKPAVEIEVICSDKAEHRRRAETRATDVPGLVKPGWQATTDRVYEDWGGRPIVVDTALQSIDTIVADLILRLQSTMPFAPR